MLDVCSIEMRKLVLINTDPQHRCYNGCHYSSELVWTNWEVLQSNIDLSKIEEKLTFWRELNDYAVSQRGNGAKCEYRINYEKAN